MEIFSKMKLTTLGLSMACLLSGCCMFVPCHPGLWAYGRVTRAGTGEPIVGAAVAVFGTHFRTGADGCFKFELADGLPFTFTVTREGYKAAVSEPPRGFFKGTVELAQDTSTEPSAVTWTQSSEQGFAAAPKCD